ncbi:LIMR family protein Os06g0128200-like [Wolffia australiana]
MGDFNLALVIVAVVVCVLVFLFNVYLLVNYQHPDDANQAYFPKAVVVFGLSVAAISILMLPADVANRQACRRAIYNGACDLTLPMKDLWLAVYIIDAILVFFIIPFAMFYYEGDQDKSVGKRLTSALIWVFLSALICGLVLGILYGLVGKLDFTVRRLPSSVIEFPTDWNRFTSANPCVSTDKLRLLCDAYAAPASSETTWTMRSTFPEYVVALATIVGSVLFTIFGGVGIFCLPLGLIFSFVRRPKAVITRSQYIKEATELGKRAKELKKTAETLRQEERSGTKGKNWRKNVKAVEKELLLLEDDMKALEEMYPQGEKAETSWALTVLGYLGKLVLGVIGLIVSVAWVVHIIIYLLIDPPVSAFLNQVFIKLDDVWGLLGTGGFAFFCLYLLLAVIAGAMMLGLKIVFVTIHPMKWGGTLMNSFLFNVALVLLCSISVIQFCSTAFGYYARATAAQEIFGHTLQSLRGIKYLYKYNVFQYGFVIFAALTLVYYLAFGWRKRKPRGRFQIST